jgi:hypothetical protein
VMDHENCLRIDEMKRFMTITTLLLMAAGSANAALLTFDDAISGATSYSFDGDGDTIYDVIFSTTDSFGFNTVGPGSNMTYIQEPGLEGTSLLSPDLRVDFLVGAVDALTFGFALDSYTEDDTATFTVYDSSAAVLASTTVTGLYTLPGGNQSSFPEGEVSVTFAGVAAYATFDFTSDWGRYIIDNFEGTFGSTERISIDIKPGSCPNPFNGKSAGSVPVAIVGTAGFDVAEVDISSLTLNGVPIVPDNVLFADVTQPGDYSGDCYDCFNEDDYLTDIDGDGIGDIYLGDGFPDLVVKFDTQALAAAIGPADRDQCIELTLTGLLIDGTAFDCSDSMVMKTKIK